jgi:predicted metal-dependent HD superfamily phosphohydrolase
VTGLIELSVTSSTDEHNMEGVFGKSDQHYFLDINFTHLASDWKDYLEFSLKTRTEYEFLNDSAYKSLRLKVCNVLF